MKIRKIKSRCGFYLLKENNLIFHDVLGELKGSK